MSVADRLLALFQSSELASRNVAAAALQRSLMPDQLPQLPGLTMAGRYVPAEGDLGGDWYDVFVLPDGSVGFVMGDVMGHGFTSAVIMGRLRSSLRSYALDHADPAEVLHRLDRKIEHFEPGAMATVLYGVTKPPFATVRFSSAGHLPPIVAMPGMAGELAVLAPDLPLGTSVRHPRHSTDLALPVGASICLYTDGLVELRPGSPDERRSIDEQISRVRGGISADDPEVVADRLIAQTPSANNPADDIAILVIKRLS